jgi:TetR/AcrR family transcriptional regulator
VCGGKPTSSCVCAITRPTLVYRFGSKDGLRTAVLEAVMAHWRDELPRIMAAASSDGPTIDSLLGALFSFFRADPARARLLLREMLDRPEPMSELLRKTVQPWTLMINQAVCMGQGPPGCRTDGSEVMRHADQERIRPPPQG